MSHFFPIFLHTFCETVVVVCRWAEWKWREKRKYFMWELVKMISEAEFLRLYLNKIIVFSHRQDIGQFLAHFWLIIPFSPSSSSNDSLLQVHYLNIDAEVFFLPNYLSSWRFPPQANINRARIAYSQYKDTMCQLKTALSRSTNQEQISALDNWIII